MYESINRKTKSALLRLGVGGKCPTYASEALGFHTDVGHESLRQEAFPLQQESIISVLMGRNT